MRPSCVSQVLHLPCRGTPASRVANRPAGNPRRPPCRRGRSAGTLANRGDWMVRAGEREGQSPSFVRPAMIWSLASAMSLPPMSSSSLRHWAEPGELGEATALPGRGPRALTREGLPGRAGKRAPPGPTRDSTTMTLMRPLSPMLCGARATAACSSSALRLATPRAPRRPTPLQDAGSCPRSGTPSPATSGV